jgi:fibronectin-binding autotransporter adhesin
MDERNGHAPGARTLRGGRMTKWKGEAASYAPNVTEVVASLAGRALALSLATGLAVGGASAADRYWDVNGTAVGRGGGGAWNTSGAFWSPSGDGVSGPYSAWNNGALDSAVFGGTAGTVTLGAPISAGGLTFETTGYMLNGGTLTLGGAAPSVTTSPGVTATINSILAGTGGLTKAGTGALVLGGANAFSGDVNVLAGTLRVNDSTGLGDAGNGVTLAGGASLSSAGSLAGRTITLTGGQSGITGAGAGNAHFTGAGGVITSGTISFTDDTNDYEGATTVSGGGNLYFSSIADLGVASALGAATDAASGTISLNVGTYASAYARYTGDGDSSNRNWRLGSHFYQASGIVNEGTGTLTLTGDIASAHTASSISVRNITLDASTADLEILGTISSNNAAVGVVFAGGGTGRTITVGGTNTFGGVAAIQGVTVKANSIRDTGIASALGTGANGAIGITDGVLSYVGGGDSSNRDFGIVGNSTLANDGTGALALSGNMSVNAAGTLTLGGSFAGANTLSGVVSGAGNLAMNGAGTWLLSGANTFSGSVKVENGTLAAGNAQAFGAAPGAAIVNGGTLDLNGFDTAFTSLSGTAGEVALTGANLTVNGAANSTFGGVISGSGGLTKTGKGVLTLSGASTYVGDTTLGGGKLALDFSASGAPASNIISADSTLNIAGGALAITGADGVANIQTFDGLNISAGSNRISATSGSGGSVTVNFGAINRTGGIIDFALPDDGSFTTTSTALGGWATVNGSDYAKVDGGGNIVAFTATDYTNKDDAGNWLSGEVISDVGNAADTPFFGTVSGSVQLGGLKYTAAAASTVYVGAGETLGIDGTIIVAASVGANNQHITGGSMTGGTGGGTLGVYQNGQGRFTIDSTIVDNGGATGFTKSGEGTARLGGANSYTGVTTLSGGRLEIMSLADAGSASSIGAAGVDSSNLVLESGTLAYLGGTDAVTNRGFTLVNGGATNPAIEVNTGRTVEFSGLVTSPDDAGLTKTGAGTLVLSNAANDYVGVTRAEGAGSTLSVNTLANGGFASGIGKSSSDSENLVLSAGGGLQYTGGTAATDRGFTLEGAGGRIDVEQAATTLTVSGIAAGAGGLTKEGAGTLVLSGTNTYTGNTVVDGGTLRAGSAQAFGPGSAFMTVNGGGRLELGGYDMTIAGLLGNGTVDLGNNTLTSHGGSANGFTGKITGTGGFTRSGSWTQTLSGCQNDYTGATTVSGGTLAVDCLANGGQASGIGASSAASANLALKSGNLVYTGGTVTTDRGFTLQAGWGGINVSDAATTLEFSGQVVGGGGLDKQGAGTLVLSGSNDYAGGTWVTGGILRAGSNAAFGRPSRVGLDNRAGALLDLAGFDTTLGYLTGGGSLGGNVALNGATLSLIYNGGTATFAGAIEGTGALVKGGNFTQELTSCTSDYSGSTTINGGVLAVSCLTNGGIASSIGMSSADAGNLVINGGTLRYIGAGDSTDRQFTLGASGGNALDASGTGAINFTSTAAVAFAAANTAQTLTLTGTNAADNRLGARITNNGSGETSLTKTGTGTWILGSSTSDYTGRTVISGGVLGVERLTDGGAASSIGASSSDAANLVIGNGSTLRYTGSGDTTNRLFTLSSGVTYLESSGSGAIVFTDTGPVTLADNNRDRTIALGGSNTGNNTLAGSIGDAGTGKTILAKNDAGTWVLTGNNTYTGNTVVNDGILKIGGGGTTGSIASDVIVTNNGQLAFNRSDSYSYDGLISGSGGIGQIGSGTTILTGANSYTGTTSVTSGTLLVNGDQSGATGLTNVGTGGTLGGTGVIGGSVVVGSGTLAPGSNGAGTLTINGSLALGSSSTLAMQFGKAYTLGDALNDHIVVNGDLTLDGTLNVTETAGGTFGPGLYRIVSYTGNLTDNGLDVGTLPNGIGTIQTAVAGQVNLFAGGNNFSFWDGDGGPKFNGAVNGGNGTWQGAGGNNNWTESTGNINAAYSDGTFAIFAGSAGTVTVDNGFGQVTAKGMQFATDGYVVTGDSIGLVGTDATIRVGDGTAAGAGMTATINSILTGTSKLVKTDAGTLVLAGANTYSGGTAINGGTIRISSDASLGTGDISFNGGTLNTTASLNSGKNLTLDGAGTLLTDAGTILALQGAVGGSGALTKDGGGDLLLLGNAAHTGGTTIAAGTLQVGNGGTTGSIAGDIVNNGVLVFNRADALTYSGAVSGTGEVHQTGAGTTSFTGVSTYTGRTVVGQGELSLESGGRISSTSQVLVGYDAGESATVTVDGAGSSLHIAGPAIEPSFIGNNGTGTLNITNGGTVTAAMIQLGAGSTGQGTLNVIGAGSSYTSTATGTSSAAMFRIGGSGKGVLNITDGGSVENSGDVGVGFLSGGEGTVTVSGANSTWTIGNALRFVNGTLSVLDGGAVKAKGVAIGAQPIVTGNSSVLVSGADSRLDTTDGVTLTAFSGETSVLTIADGGVIKVGNGSLAMTGSDALLNIGGVEGGPLEHAGTLDAASVTMAAATNRVNFNHDTADYQFDAVISGTGHVSHNGTGATVLTGDNSYTGATSVNLGSLYINGDQSGATGGITVSPAGTLGGNGTIGGDVLVVGGRVNPGDLGTAPGTLTVNGDLSLMLGSNLDFNFGQANVPGGPLNDLINVGGDLTLNGSLNVQASPGGSFDPGVYRVINYAGSLSGSGLTLGGTPPPGLYIQTSIDHEVNLVNTAGMALRYWDGDAGPKNDGNIDGGNGIWQAFGTAPDNGNDNWTEDGAVNAPFMDAAFAVLAGASGVVTADDSKGAINVSGMQFMTDGYRVTGDGINLVGASGSVIRVGDGTTGGAGTTATITASLNGSARLTKSDMGTLVLLGSNSYTGGTTINGGTLEIFADINLGNSAGDLTFNGGVLHTTASFSTARTVALAGAGTFRTDTGRALELQGSIIGSGVLTKDGAGALVLTTDSAHTGGTTIAEGMLQLGNGGTSGSVAGNIVNDGFLAVNRSDALTLGGKISGSGAFGQSGSGTTILTGANSYKGNTRVNAGALLINGDQSLATGTTTAAGGATLGGAGIIGGGVIIADGATLQPGSTLGAASTLTIKGDLSLGAGSKLAMQFGEANVEGGGFNDLVNVGGDLTLDGTLDVSVSPGGLFGAGIYRVINYAGTLTDNGLTLGAMPADSDVFLQTSVAGQVNLVNGAGLTLNYWDGAAGPKFDDSVNGGDGIWQGATGNHNWTDAAGDINAPYTNGSYAIFTGVAGTVTVDNSLGQVETTGMQFATDGYRIEGGELKLAGSEAVIRVGDGATPGMTATIASILSGSAELVKSDLGTLILVGDNSYTGGTTMAGGTLQVAADTALGDSAGGLSFNGGTLNTTADMTSDRSVALDGDGTFLTDGGTSLTLNGVFSGTGSFEKAGQGMLTLTADSSAFAGSGSVNNGTLVVNGTLGGGMTVAAGGRLEGIGKVGTTSNSGTIAAGNGGIGTLTIGGSYTGNDGRIEIVTVLGGDSSDTSRLVVTGSTSGTTQIGVTNRGGLGDQTVEGIKIVDVGGTSSGTFTLDGDYLFEGEQAVVAGAYGYRLYKGGISNPNDGDWYLRSALLDPVDPSDPLYQPGVPVYESYAGTLQQFNKLTTMQQRIGNRVWGEKAAEAQVADAKGDRVASRNGIWARIEAAHADFEPAESRSRAKYDASVWKLQTGVDGLLAQNDTGRFVGGVFVQYGTVSSGIRSPYGVGGIDTTGYGLGATLTWFGENGLYADAQAQVTWFDSDLNSATAGKRLVSGNNGVGYALSIEAGQRIALGGAWSLTPQAQLAYSSVRFDDFTDVFGAGVSLDRSESLVGRLGIAANHDVEWRGATGQLNRAHLYGIANLYYEFAGRSRVAVSDISFASRNDRLYGGLGIGGSLDWADAKYSIYGEAQVNTSLENMGDNNAIGGTVGFRMQW